MSMLSSYYVASSIYDSHIYMCAHGLYSHILLHLDLLPFPAVAVLCHNDLQHMPYAVQFPESLHVKIIVYTLSMYIHVQGTVSVMYIIHVIIIVIPTHSTWIL